MAELDNASNRRPSKFNRIDFNAFIPPSDPGIRPQICEYHPNDREGVRRSYLAKGPCQPKLHDFEGRDIGSRLRGFNPKWYDDFGSWLEYSIEKEAVYCLFCFLFKPELGGRQGGGDTFILTGWKAWNKGREALLSHISKANSFHMQNELKARTLLNQRQAISSFFGRHNDKSRKDYRVRMNASLDCIRYLLRQGGGAFRAHDESTDSYNKGNFLELVKFLADHNAEVKSVALDKAPKNLQLTSPDFQKEMVHAAAQETTKVIIHELGDDLFAILVDESRDVSCKEQMALVIRFVRKDGNTVERFLDIVHVLNTTAASLKVVVESKLAAHSLSLSRVRGQGYDGASNMRGEFNGLKSLILRTNSSAYYVHCFAHQLQLTLVAVANSHIDVAHLFTLTDKIQNTVGASCKRRDMLRERQAAEIAKALNNGEKEMGKGLNQEMGLARAGATRWGSHYRTVTNVIELFTPIFDVLETIEREGMETKNKGDAKILLDGLPTFDCVFVLHLMQDVLGLTNVLSQALQKKDQDIVNAIGLVKVAKMQLQRMREDGWDPLLQKVSLFCIKQNISIPSMEATFVAPGRSRRGSEQITNLHRFRVQIFNTILDMQLTELNDRFDEISSELLLCVACLNPRDAFEAFDRDMLIKLASFYPREFENIDMATLGYQLDTYIIDIHLDERFKDIRDLNELSIKLVETKKSLTFPYVYLLIKLALLLPVATASVERVFSAMTFIKTKLRNRMGDAWMNDCLVTYIEREVFNEIPNEPIMQNYQNMKTRRELL